MWINVAEFLFINHRVNYNAKWSENNEKTLKYSKFYDSKSKFWGIYNIIKIINIRF